MEPFESPEPDDGDDLTPGRHPLEDADGNLPPHLRSRPVDHSIIRLSPPTRLQWRRYLREFERDMVPIFEDHGFSRDTALQVFALNQHEKLLHQLLHAIHHGS